MIIYEFKNANNENNKLVNEENKFIEFKKIEFKNVEFNYSVNKQTILKNVNFEINQGDFIGIQGKSGSGKSTLIDLLTSLLKPTNGKIFVNGIDLKNIDNDWKKIIGYVPQDIFISDTTLKNNIAFSLEKNEVDEIHLKECLEKAQINEFLDQFPDRENTSVGERGLKLSGGQVQRIAIARCLYKKSQILIFDESTNALDAYTEQKILDTIYSLKKEKTIIMISHKINTLKNCDKVFKISNKEIFSDNK
jgi:ABC-type bacteriocin/lantibiotic exporters, contain an N-terminal double-glycine peptidase domain